MARKKSKKDENRTEGKGLMDRLSLVVTLVVVSVFAIFTGYLVGQYAIHWIASPIVGEVEQEPSGTRLADGGAGAPASSSSTASSSTDSSAADEQPDASPPPTSAAVAASSASQTPNPSQDEPSIFRVHVGHFEDQEAAAAVAQDLIQRVPDAWVVFDSGSGEYRVQAGAFSSRDRANEFAQNLISLGHDAYVAQ